jgi:hypothetical protein
MIYRNFNKMFVALVFLLVVFASSFGIAAYWMMWPYDPITIHSITILNPDKTVRAGEPVRYHIEWVKRTDKQGVLHRYFVNGHKYGFDKEEGVITSAPIGPGSADVTMETSPDMPIGTGRVQWSIAYQMNPLRNVIVPPAYSDSFTVILDHSEQNEIETIMKMVRRMKHK